MWLIIIIVILLYAVLVLWTNANMYAFDKKTKIISIIVGIVITFIITTILVLTSGVPDVQAEIKTTMNIMNILLFSAINALIVVPTIAKIFNRKKTKELTNKQVKTQILIRAVIFFAMILIEISYLHSFQNMITKI